MRLRGQYSFVMKVAVIGGGLGGLTLAHALRSAHFHVEVFEATRSSEGRKRASRVTLDDSGLAALRACLPAYLLQVVQGTASHTMHGLSVRDDSMRLLSRTKLPRDLEAHVLLADRTVLRDVLAAGLGDVYREGRRFVGYLPRADGRFDLHFSDGATHVADVVVGADGIDSTVRRLRLPQWPQEQVSTVTLTGRLPLSMHTLLPREVLNDDTIIVGKQNTTMLLAPLRLRDGAAATFSRAAPGRPPPQDSLSWQLTVPREGLRAPQPIEALKPRELHLVAREHLLSLAPELRAIVDDSDPESITALPAHFVPSLSAWKPEAVTLLGDAIHALPATAPVGVNATLRDAQALAAQLLATRDGKPLLEAIGAYEAELRAVGTRLIADARRVQQMTATSATWYRRLIGRVLPPLLKLDLWKRRRNVTSPA